MSLSKPAIAALTISMGLSGAQPMAAQEYPYKPIRIISSEPGGAGDFSSRIIAPALSVALGQPVIVNNRAGVSQAEIVSNGLPDGYTVLIDGNSFWIGPLVRKAPYDPVRDFAPVTSLSSSPNILVVHPSVAANTVKDLIALAKAKPGVLNYGSSSAGTAAHLSAELLKSMANVNIVRVAYKGGGPALTALLGGEVQLVFATATSVTQHIKSGRVRALAVTTAQPSALVPGLPTIAASGFPGYESTFMQGVWVPIRTPASVVTRLNKEFVLVLRSTEVKEKFSLRDRRQPVLRRSSLRRKFNPRCQNGAKLSRMPALPVSR